MECEAWRSDLSRTSLIGHSQLLSKDGKKGMRGSTRIYDDCTSTVILFNPKTKQFISYEDSVSVQAKTVSSTTVSRDSEAQSRFFIGVGQEARPRGSHGIRQHRVRCASPRDAGAHPRMDGAPCSASPSPLMKTKSVLGTLTILFVSNAVLVVLELLILRLGPNNAVAFGSLALAGYSRDLSLLDLPLH